MRIFFKSNSEKGQSLIEYILLMLVIVTITTTIFRSDYFKRFFGPESEFFRNLAKTQEYTFRHSHYPTRIAEQPDQENPAALYSGDEHPSYVNQEQGKSRFFIPDEPYL